MDVRKKGNMTLTSFPTIQGVRNVVWVGGGAETPSRQFLKTEHRKAPRTSFGRQGGTGDWKSIEEGDRTEKVGGGGIEITQTGRAEKRSPKQPQGGRTRKKVTCHQGPPLGRKKRRYSLAS